jgi:ribonuclease HI
MLHNQVVAGHNITLCYTKTVFMAEVIAITSSLRTLLDKLNDGTISCPGTITVFSDSQSALKALTSTDIHTQTVLECIQTIKALQPRYHIKFAWVKAHARNYGNKMADRLAKEGARRPRPVEGPGPFHSVPHTFVRTITYQNSMDLWQTNWTRKQKARQTKIFCPTINMKKGKEVAKLNREDAGAYIRWITGHNFLCYHKSLIDECKMNPMCRLYRQELESSSLLLLGRCVME